MVDTKDSDNINNSITSEKEISQGESLLKQKANEKIEKKIWTFIDIAAIEKKYDKKVFLYLYRTFLQEMFFSHFRNFTKVKKEHIKKKLNDVKIKLKETEEQKELEDSPEIRKEIITLDHEKDEWTEKLNEIEKLISIWRSIKDASALEKIEERILKEMSWKDLELTIMNPETSEDMVIDFTKIIEKVSKQAHKKVADTVEKYKSEAKWNMLFQYYLFHNWLLKDTVIEMLIKEYAKSKVDETTNINIHTSLEIFKWLNVAWFAELKREFDDMVQFLYDKLGDWEDFVEFSNKIRKEILLINREWSHWWHFLIWNPAESMKYYEHLSEFILQKVISYNANISKQIRQKEEQKERHEDYAGDADEDTKGKKSLSQIYNVSVPIYLTSKDRFWAVTNQIDVLLKNDEVLWKQFQLGDKTIEEYMDEISDSDDTKLNKEIEKMYHIVLKHIVETWASDIHFHPYMQEEKWKIQYRVHWKMYDFKEVSSKLFNRIVWVIEQNSQMQIWDSKPQDDWVIQDFIVNENLVVNFRVAVIWCPSKKDWEWIKKHCVLRVLVNDRIPTLWELSYRDDIVEEVRSILGSSEHWIFLVTWPTWSGKSTLLYSALYEYSIKHADKMIYSVENPIEKIVPTIAQIEIDPKFNQDFKTTLKMLLRADPDVIFVWEIRDPETAELATDAAETWHLVLATLHVNSAIEVIERLMALEVDEEKVKKTLIWSIAQRLITKLCPHCKREIDTTDLFVEEMEKAHWVEIELPDNKKLYTKWTWCDKCNSSWVVWRIPIIEIINFKKVDYFADTNELKEKLANLWFKNMFDRAMEYMIEEDSNVDYKAVVSLYDNNTDLSELIKNND